MSDTQRPDERVERLEQLCNDFRDALLEKARAAERKYGYNDGWLADDWRDDLVAKLLHHVEKGDPRDVALYCAFAWYHGWSISPNDIRAVLGVLNEQRARAERAEAANRTYEYGLRVIAEDALFDRGSVRTYARSVLIKARAALTAATDKEPSDEAP